MRQPPLLLNLASSENECRPISCPLWLFDRHAQVTRDEQKQAHCSVFGQTQEAAEEWKQLPQQICLYFSGQALFDLSEEIHVMWLFSFGIHMFKQTYKDGHPQAQCLQSPVCGLLVSNYLSDSSHD